MEERLQKLISRAGVTSRRKGEELIAGGRVSVNGKIISELGAKADPEVDRIVVDGKLLHLNQTTHHLLFYKPKGVMTTLSDPENRPTVKEYLRGIKERLYPVGRLDFNSEGLLILTNDGDLAHRIMHASTSLPKTYWVKVAGRPANEALARLREGVYIDGKRTAPAQIKWLSNSGASGRERESAGVYRTSSDNPWLEVVLIEGRNHQIRKMFLSIGHPVEKLKRVAIGKLSIGALKSGQMRPLTEVEINQLRSAAKPKPMRGGLPVPRPERKAATAGTPRGGARAVAPRSGARAGSARGGARRRERE